MNPKKTKTTKRTAKNAPKCPRCGGCIPCNETPGAYPGAISRTDGVTEICSACGENEGLEAFRRHRGIDLDDKACWPS